MYQWISLYTDGSYADHGECVINGDQVIKVSNLCYYPLSLFGTEEPTEFAHWILFPIAIEAWSLRI